MGANDIRRPIHRAIYPTVLWRDHIGIYVRCALGICRKDGPRHRIYSVGHPRALGIFNDRGRTGRGGDEPDRRVPRTAHAGLAVLALGPDATLVDAVAHPVDRDRRRHAVTDCHLMPDAKTIAFYDKAAQRYADSFATGTPSDSLRAFMDLLPAGGTVLDLGCGPARASAHMRDAGFLPDPVDASQGMVTLANETYDINARILTFDQVDMIAAYDGVWANFALLHAPRSDLPDIIARLATALRSRGAIHIALKTGTGEQRDKIDRLYTYLTVAELRRLLTNAGFTIIATTEGSEVGCAGTNDPFVVMRAHKND